MEGQKSKQIERIIMLPSNEIWQSIKPLIADQKDFSVRFINGYKNILQKYDNSVQWALVQDEDHCGQAFCYLIKASVNEQTILSTVIKQKHQLHKSSDQTFVILSKQPNPPIQTCLSLQQVTNLLSQVRESKQTIKLAINLLKNSFASYESYKQSAQQSITKIEQAIQNQKLPTLPTVGQTITWEQNAKRLHEDMIRTVPKIDMLTGTWDQTVTIQVKLAAE